MLIDLHAHTHPLSHDSLLSADDLVDAAKQAGLDGVCLTEHDFFWEGAAAADLAKRHHFLVLPGIEVNTEDGHILVFGLVRFVYGMHRTAELARLAAQAGGVMIAAHPYRRQLPFELRHDGDWTAALDGAAANPAYQHVHAIETHNGPVAVAYSRFTKPSRFETHNGAIDIRMPAEARFHVDARGHHLGVKSDFPITTEGFGESRYVGNVNGGGPELRFTTHNGSMRLRKV